MSDVATTSPLSLFEAIGVEIEYMLVDRDTLAVLPKADLVLQAAAGEIVSEIEMGALSWSNELVLHVLELKTNGPAASIDGLVEAFEADVKRADAFLEPLGGRLMPGAMHPFMEPLSETRLWPHEHSPIYEAYDRIFSCRGHGWSNLQSLHLNLPFQGDEEFARLHAAVRLVLPLLPALAASSPLYGGRFNGVLDNRLEFYRTNSKRIPSLTGLVIPEPVWSEAAYRREIFERLYRDVAPHDPDGVLRDEFLNSRGAIARFGRGSIEIRLLDSQECPRADLAIAVVVVEVLRLLVEERWCDLEEQQSWDTETLAALFRHVVATGERTLIHDRDYLAVFGVEDHAALRAGELWAHLVDEIFAYGTAEGGTAPAEEWRDVLEAMIAKGPLARRIRQALGAENGVVEPAPEAVREVYGELCECLRSGELFRV